MSLITQPEINKKGEIANEPSSYKPSKKVQERLEDLQKDFKVADEIMSNSYAEFNQTGIDLDLSTYIAAMQARFNNTPPPKRIDPEEEWRANVVRPITRNKVISIVATLTGSTIQPDIVAQNEDASEDRDMAMVMQDAVDWSNEQANYEEQLLVAVQDLCVNPGVIIHQDFAKVMKKIKEIQEDGSWKFKEVLDELFSGFKMNIVSLTELYIGNAYEPNIQKQPFLIRRKNITYEEAERKYGDIDDFIKYVRPGIKTFYSEENGTFFETTDLDLEDRLVEEVIYWNCYADLELRIINGILLDDPDRPMQRVDKMYPFAKNGFEKYNSSFFYHMPVVAKMIGDQDVIDVLYNMTIDGTYLQLMPPIGIYGSEEVDSSILVPGKATAFNDPQSRIDPLQLGNNLNSGLALLQKVESSASESSQSPLASGQGLEGTQTKFEVQQLQLNATKNLSLAGRFLGKLVQDYTNLLIGSIIQHLPIAVISEVMGDSSALEFPKLFLMDRDVEGKKMNRRIEFTTDMPEAEDEEELKEKEKEASYKVLSHEEQEEMSIIMVEPEAFREMKYKVKVIPEFIDKQTKFAKSMFIYDRAIQNPKANQEAIYRDFLLRPLVPGEEDKYIAEEQPAMEAGLPLVQGEGAPQAMPQEAVQHQ